MACCAAASWRTTAASTTAPSTACCATSGKRGSARSASRSSIAERRQQRLSGVERGEVEATLDLVAARVTRRQDALAIAGGVDLVLPRQGEDAARLLLVTRLVPVHAAH